MAVPPDPPSSERLRFDRFKDRDAEGLAALLADPEIARNITTDGSTPERCLASARARIARHNAVWDSHGYGVWALRARDGGRGIIGWCGFVEPYVPSEGPEILYGLARDCWGQGLGSEAARAAIDWLFGETRYPDVSALIFGRLNPGSVGIAEKLGMTPRGSFPFAKFLPEKALAQAVLDYEIWRLREGDCLEPETLLFQAPYKAGQIVGTGVQEPDAIERALQDAALARQGFAGEAPVSLRGRVAEAFRQGLKETHVDWYSVTREAWHER